MNKKKLVARAVWPAIVLLSACGGGGGGSGSPAAVTPTPVTVTLSASPQRVTRGAYTTLSWSSQNATSCQFTAGSNQTVALNGSGSVGPLNAAVTFTLTCQGNGQQGSASTRIEVDEPVPPSATLTLSDDRVILGQVITVSWASTNATSCQIQEFSLRDLAPSGTATVGPLTITDEQTVRLECTGPAGTVTVPRVIQGLIITGLALSPLQHAGDLDGNDRFVAAGYELNDLASGGQNLPDLGTAAGYVTEKGKGPDGYGKNRGDIEDAYRVPYAKAGDIVELRLLAPRPADGVGDVDLYLFDLQRTLVDASVTAGDREQVAVPRDGDFFVVVRVDSGSAQYILTHRRGVAANSNAANFNRLSESFVLDEAIVHLRPESATSKKGAAAGESRLPGIRKAGRPDRAMLMGLRSLAAVPSAKPTRPDALVLRDGNVMTALQSARLDTLRAIKRLAARSDVATASPNLVLARQATTNDPLLAQQAWHYNMIDLPAAWDATTGSPNVIVAVVDTGILPGHPDLVGRLIPGYDFVSNPAGLDGDGLDADPTDPGELRDGQRLYHGTHVAGTIAAAGNNGIGGAGVAYGSQLMPLRALDGATGTAYDVMQAIRYAAGLANDSGRLPDRPVDVINLSLGARGDCTFDLAELLTLVEGRGTAIVASVGNDNLNGNAVPAACPGVIGVSAVGAGGDKAPYSNYGRTADVAAPGGDLNADRNGDGRPDGILSTHGDGYTMFAGTSMAAPHVSGTLALMKSARPSLRPFEITQLLNAGLLTSIPSPNFSQLLGVGVISARKSVEVARGVFPDPPIVHTTPTAIDLGLIWADTKETGIRVTNVGGGLLTVQSVTSSVPWMSVTRDTVDSAGLGWYRVIANKSGLAEGFYEGQLQVTTSHGVRNVPVIMATTQFVAGNGGGTWSLALDAATGERRESHFSDSRQIVFRYTQDGRYLIVSGTDFDNDGLICEVGEFCGTHPTIDNPEIIDYRRRLDGVNVIMMINEGTNRTFSVRGGSGNDWTLDPGSGLSYR